MALAWFSGQLPACHRGGRVSIHARFAEDKVELRLFFPTKYFDIPRQYLSNNSPHSSSCTCCSYQKEKRAKPGNLPKNNVISEIAEQ